MMATAAAAVNTPADPEPGREEESRGTGKAAAAEEEATAPPAAEEEEVEEENQGPTAAAAAAPPAAAAAAHAVAAPPHSRVSKLPLTRIKALMKADPDVSLASQESVFVIAKATELFVEMIAKDSLVYAQQGKRKTLQRKDLDNAIEAIDEFAFLEGTLD